jgi:hypothetical protein
MVGEFYYADADFSQGCATEAIESITRSRKDARHSEQHAPSGDSGYPRTLVTLFQLGDTPPAGSLRIV